MSLIRSKLAKSSYLVSRMVSTAQHRANIDESLLWISSADGRSSIFASLTSTSSFGMRMRVEWAWRRRKDGLRDAA